MNLLSSSVSVTRYLVDDVPDAPPLEEYRGPMLIVLPGEDTAELALLEEILPRSFVKTVPYPSGRPAIYAVYSE